LGRKLFIVEIMDVHDVVPRGELPGYNAAIMMGAAVERTHMQPVTRVDEAVGKPIVQFCLIVTKLIEGRQVIPVLIPTKYEGRFDIGEHLNGPLYLSAMVLR
jgi:hypothetical protein